MMAKGLLTAAMTVLMAGSAAAEPAKAPTETIGQKAEVVLASADIPAQVQASPGSSESSAPTPAKRPRAARVTTCRCGDSSSPR